MKRAKAMYLLIKTVCHIRDMFLARLAMMKAREGFSLL